MTAFAAALRDSVACAVVELDHARREGDDLGEAAYGARLAYLLAVAADHDVDIDAEHPDGRSRDDLPMPLADQP